MSIIISVEREGVRDTPLGMKEMKNMFYKAMYRNALNDKFDEIMMYKEIFRDEIMHTDFNDYENDMLDDCLVMLRTLNLYKHEPYIDEKFALKITKWYESVDNLLFDIRSYLLSEFNLYPNDMIENYKKECK